MTTIHNCSWAPHFQYHLSQWELTEPSTDKDGKVRQGATKTLYNTKNPNIVALVEPFPHAQREIDLLFRLQGISHLPETHFCFRLNYTCVSIQTNLGPNLRETFLQPNSEKILLPNLERIAKQLLEALASIHERGILHADISPSNCSAKGDLFDFSLAQEIGEQGICALLYAIPYRPPEVSAKQATFFSADIWALGCVLYELFTGNLLIPNVTVHNTHTGEPHRLEEAIALLNAYQECTGQRLDLPLLAKSYPTTVEERENTLCLKRSLFKPLPPYKEVLKQFPSSSQTNHFYDLLDQMLQIDPTKRITAKDALSHPFFTSNHSNDIAFKLTVQNCPETLLHVRHHSKRIVATLSIPCVAKCCHIWASSQPHIFQIGDKEFKLTPQNGESIILNLTDSANITTI
jgi:serine/threonine protein kinase